MDSTRIEKKIVLKAAAICRSSKIETFLFRANLTYKTLYRTDSARNVLHSRPAFSRVRS